MNLSKRNFMKLLAIPSFIYLSQASILNQLNIIKKTPSLSFLDDDYLIVNGWIMLRTDLKG
jgi:hypothetical protein